MAGNKRPKTPSMANWLANQFINEALLEEFFGDLEEIFQDRISIKGKAYAKLMYWVDMLHLLIGFTSLQQIFRNQHNPTIMYRHYFTIAGRNLSRNKLNSLINILGLAVGMGVCLLIYQYVHFEMSYDNFHANAHNIYRLTQTDIRNGENLGAGAYTTHALGVQGKETIPEIKDFVRICPQKLGLVVANVEDNIIFQENKMWYVDHNFLEFFNFPLRYGDWESALGAKYNVVITEETAYRYFGNGNPIGKSLKVSGGKSLSGIFIVTGVLKKLPINSHLEFDLLLSMEFLLENWPSYKGGGGWVNADFITYITLDDNANPEIVGKKYNHAISEQISSRLHLERRIGFQAISDIHLNSDYLKGDPASNKGNMQDVHFFIIIAIFILFMAWVNYINLSTARAMDRAKEVGVRKSIGAVKNQLISQFIIESALTNFIAAILAIGIAYFMLPVLSNIIGKELELNVVLSIEFWGWFSLVIILGSLLSGLYPAFVLSSFKPVRVFKSANTTHRGGFSLRRTLIIFQFLTSVLLISGTYLVYQQITFMKNKDLGIDMEKILVLNGPRVVLEKLKEEGVTLGSKYQIFKTKAADYHSISSISATYTIPGKGYFFGSTFIRKLGNPEDSGKPASVTIVDTDFADTYDLEFLAERDYIKDYSALEQVIINEEALKVFELGSAEEALYEKLIWGGDTIDVVGVVKNVHWNSLRDAHSPILYFLDNEWGAYFSCKMNLSDVQPTIAHIESAYHEVFPNDPFHYFFLDDEFNKQYQSDLQFGNLFSVFSVLAIFIAC